MAGDVMRLSDFQTANKINLMEMSCASWWKAEEGTHLRSRAYPALL